MDHFTITAAQRDALMGYLANEVMALRISSASAAPIWSTLQNLPVVQFQEASERPQNPAPTTPFFGSEDSLSAQRK